tara:strand:+ start:1918 stop:3237 length:1320 start_codon:yes stop_codon:yes gene_type:complete
MKRFCIQLTILILFSFNSVLAEISYKEILDNPTDLELNLNYAKQQEKVGNFKLTIATLERLNILYPSNSDIKLYLLSILIKMDSKVKVELMIQTMLNDPNTTDETRVLIAELLSNDQIEEQNKKWFAYIDLTYTQTREDNISAITKTKKLLQDDVSIPFPVVDDHLIVDNDKIHTKGSSLTFGKNFDNTSSIYFNFGLDINTQNKKATGDSEIISGSTSYFKVLGNHYISPYVYYSRPNYKRLEDYNTKGVGFNNTYIVNEKNNINYGISYSNTSYDQTNTFDAADDKNFENYSSNIRYNFNFSPTTQLSSKLILNKIDSSKNYDSYDSEGINFSISQIIKYGTLKLQTTFIENTYEAKDTFISSTIDRKDESLVSTISLSGQLNQIIPFAKKMNKDDSIFYSLKFKHSDISSNIINYDVDRKFLSLGLTKRLNLNEIF